MTPEQAISPFKSHFLDRGGLRLHYLDEGSGPAIVCVHGNPTWCYYYRRVVEAFSGTHRVIVPDHIGCGLSDKPGDDRYRYTLASRVDDLLALIDHLKLGDNITLMVHDWGGMIGMSAARQIADRIRRLVILNTAAFLLPSGAPLPARLKLIRNGGPLGSLIVRGFNGFAWPATWMAVRRPLDAQTKAALLAPYDSWANRIATQRFVQDIPLSPSDPAYDVCLKTQQSLAQFADRPALICWGRHDFVFNDAFLAEWRRHLPNADVNVFEDAGHYVLEDAHERIIPLMRGFFEKHGV